MVAIVTEAGAFDGLLADLGEQVMSAGCAWCAVTDLSGTRPLVLFEAGAAPGGGWLPALAARLAAGRPPGGAASTPAAWAGVRRPDILMAELKAAEVVVVCGFGGRRFTSRERFELARLCRRLDSAWRERALRSGMDAHPSRRAATAIHPVAAS